MPDKFRASLLSSLVDYICADKPLKIPTEHYMKHIGDDIDIYIKELVRTKLLSSLNAVDSCIINGPFKVESSELYFWIRDSLKECKQFKIIDHDINRWKELNPNSPIKVKSNSDNNFNYSNEILKRTKERAKVDNDFTLKRIFIVLKHEWQQINCVNKISPCIYNCSDHKKFKNDKDKRELISILRQIYNEENNLIESKKNNVETRLCVYEWLDEERTRFANSVLDKKDIVIVDNAFIFREKFDVKSRTDSIETKSEITCEKQDVDKCLDIFCSIWDNNSIKLETIFIDESTSLIKKNNRSLGRRQHKRK